MFSPTRLFPSAYRASGYREFVLTKWTLSSRRRRGIGDRTTRPPATLFPYGGHVCLENVCARRTVSFIQCSLGRQGVSAIGRLRNCYTTRCKATSTRYVCSSNWATVLESFQRLTRYAVTHVPVGDALPYERGTHETVAFCVYSPLLCFQLFTITRQLRRSSQLWQVLKTQFGTSPQPLLLLYLYIPLYSTTSTSFLPLKIDHGNTSQVTDHRLSLSTRPS